MATSAEAVGENRTRKAGEGPKGMAGRRGADDVASRKSHRLQMDLPPKALERLQGLKEKTEAASYAEVARSAFQLYEHVIELYERGNEFMLKQPDGTISPYRLLTF